MTLVAQSRRGPLWEVREGTCAPTTEAETQGRVLVLSARKLGVLSRWPEVLQKVPPHPESVLIHGGYHHFS